MNTQLKCSNRRDGRIGHKSKSNIAFRLINKPLHKLAEQRKLRFKIENWRCCSLLSGSYELNVTRSDLYGRLSDFGETLEQLTSLFTEFARGTPYLGSPLRNYMQKTEPQLAAAAEQCIVASAPINRPPGQVVWSVSTHPDVRYREEFTFTTPRTTSNRELKKIRKIQPMQFIEFVPRFDGMPGVLVHFRNIYVCDELIAYAMKKGLFDALNEAERNPNGRSAAFKQKDEDVIWPLLSCNEAMAVAGVRTFCSQIILFFINMAPRNSQVYANVVPIQPKKVQEFGQLIEMQPLAWRYVLRLAMVNLHEFVPGAMFSESQLSMIVADVLAHLKNSYDSKVKKMRY